MKVAIISSFAPITDLLVANSLNPEQICSQGPAVFRGKLHGKELFIVPITPEVDTTAMIQALRIEGGVDYLISVGIAEPVLPQLKAGDVLVVNEALGLERNAPGLVAHKGDQRLIDLALSAQEKVVDENPRFRVLSGRTIAPELAPENPDANQELNLYALDGSGADFAWECEEIKLPHVLIRIMVPAGDSPDGEEFAREASKNAFWVIKSVLEPPDMGEAR